MSVRPAVAIALAAETLLRQGATGGITVHVPRGSIAEAQRQPSRTRIAEAHLGHEGRPRPDADRPGSSTPRRDGTPTPTTTGTPAEEHDERSVWERRGFPVAVADAMRHRGRA